MSASVDETVYTSKRLNVPAVPKIGRPGWRRLPDGGLQALVYVRHPSTRVKNWYPIEEHRQNRKDRLEQLYFRRNSAFMRV